MSYSIVCLEKKGYIEAMNPQETLSGILLVDKPAGWTSHDIVAKMRGVLGIKRIGHAGTLDPFATGLVILGINKGTKNLEKLMHETKVYETTIFLGATSTTFDTEGEITPTEPTTAKPPAPTHAGVLNVPTLEEIEEALNQFRGGYEQKAPLFSAKHIRGKRLYDLAREGKATEEMRPSKLVRIDEIKTLNYSYPKLTLKITCGSGTYIRSIADDLGHALGIGGYCLTLRRLSIGHYQA
ncbi:MAG: tRNA pseudouridine(55) synthase TruB, partial [Candidatus Magasanikbacteria bacterium]|nr:tRNA pseudouridine(55) synthase TruB [Candidatus Magasanikbacteria bacterium]